MNTDKAYILGLVIGGGCFSSDARSFYIRLPFRQWGAIDANPERAGIIATDIMKVVKPMMQIEYNLSVGYTTGKEWRIQCHGDVTQLVQDLATYNISPTSELHKTADISKLIASFGNDVNIKKRFIAGIADTIGSMAPSHRRFSADVQIISFEISGFNYRFVCQLCNLLYDVGCVPDQILWQHPNMQSGNDSYYKQWKKGNKLRVTLDSFSTFGSLAFKSKLIASRDNRTNQRPGIFNAPIKCEDKSLSVPGVTPVHIEQDHSGIPDEIRGGHYIHHKQICGALKCPHAPCRELDRLLSEAEHHISPFTVLHKDNYTEVKSIINHASIMQKRIYHEYNVSVLEIMRAIENGAKVIQFRNGIRYSPLYDNGYPLNILLDAVAYIIASKTGGLNGKRPKGLRDVIINQAVSRNPTVSVHIEAPELLTPIVVTDGNVAALIGPLNSKVYKKLISYDPKNRYKMIVRRITENDLK